MTSTHMHTDAVAQTEARLHAMQHTIDSTYSERVTFDNGDHATLTVEDPNYVTVRGHLAGETIDVDLRADVADENGYLLINGNSPDALWNLEPAPAARLGHAMIGAATAARTDLRELAQLAPLEDTTDPAHGQRVDLDDGHADIDTPGEHVELTVTLAGRITTGIALTAAEAAQIGEALTAAARRAHTAQARVDLAGVDTVTDLFRAQETGVPASAPIEQVTR